MKCTALIVAVVGTAAGTVWAVPTYNHTAVVVGGGLYGFTFFCDNTGQPPSGWVVDMQWRGLTQAEIDQYCGPGAIPGTINQIPAGGWLPIHCETEAIICDLGDPAYDMTKDTWIKEEFCYAFRGGTPMEGANSFYVESGTKWDMQYVTVDHAYVVVDGYFAYEGRLGVGLVDPVWTPISGIVVPEPAAMSLLAIGSLMLIRRRR